MSNTLHGGQHCTACVQHAIVCLEHYTACVHHSCQTHDRVFNTLPGVQHLTVCVQHSTGCPTNRVFRLTPLSWIGFWPSKIVFEGTFDNRLPQKSLFWYKQTLTRCPRYRVFRAEVMRDRDRVPRKPAIVCAQHAKVCIQNYKVCVQHPA